MVKSARLLEVTTGAVVILAAVLFLSFGLRSTSGGGVGDYYLVTAEFDDVSGVSRGSEVRMSGVRVGQVRGQRLDSETYFAILELEISGDVGLPVDTSARISADGLLGGAHVSLSPGGSLEMIGDGGEILHTQGSVSLVDLLGRFIFSGGE
ncbi:MAG: outer membrane lipid asymmetry maintenance protein MlaD [Alphaproteobacteria bacterium]|nr:outer membrane lipid asymmetry maintenance protein MlaD [Alphaproteobacteria bacterium]MDA7983322.1 outer membrane lipid asymmetry maintenance protein MlaD [Alphaproteobacteria bacterium]MDA7988745.1 outer membrane lipid asymmetry maintenance protein MlaD [Alphaproteobacteria bacterium]MDA8009072.1 outer membrane lipid asymmetry maintenance protein MlaD [Alphaproteobacteria bacterium]